MRKLNILVLQLRSERQVREITEEWLAVPDSDAQ